MAKALTKEQYMGNINKCCQEVNYRFDGFCDGNGNDCEWYGNQTYLKLHCHICGNDWHTTTYNNLLTTIKVAQNVIRQS